MYQKSEISQKPAHHTLIDAALGIAADTGVSAIAARSLGERAGMSASSVNYHFGSLGSLLETVSHRADLMRAAMWQDQLRELQTLTLRPSDFAPLAFSSIRQAISHNAGEEAFFWNDVLVAARTGSMISRRQAILEEASFWKTLLGACGIENIHLETLHCFALAVRLGYVVYHDLSAFDPWAFSLVTQFGARALGGGAPTDSAIRARAEQSITAYDEAVAPKHPTAEAILMSTIDLLIQDGAEAITHRNVAKKAGLSVSSVQHFFGGRSSLLEAAFHEVLRQTLQQKLPEPPKEQSLSSKDAFQAGSGLKPESVLREFAASQGLMLAASADLHTREIARGMFARSGANSRFILQALKSPRGAFGRLDAQIFSLTMNHVRTLSVCLESEPELLDVKVGRNLLAELFEVRQQV
jgi:AcrR family transcriptional regulator